MGSNDTLHFPGFTHDRPLYCLHRNHFDPIVTTPSFYLTTASTWTDSSTVTHAPEFSTSLAFMLRVLMCGILPFVGVLGNLLVIIVVSWSKVPYRCISVLLTNLAAYDIVFCLQNIIFSFPSIVSGWYVLYVGTVMVMAMTY